MKPLNKGHLGDVENLLYSEVSSIGYTGTLMYKYGAEPSVLYREVSDFFSEDFFITSEILKVKSRLSAVGIGAWLQVVMVTNQSTNSMPKRRRQNLPISRR